MNIIRFALTKLKHSPVLISSAILIFITAIVTIFLLDPLTTAYQNCEKIETCKSIITALQQPTPKSNLVAALVLAFLLFAFILDLLLKLKRNKPPDNISEILSHEGVASKKALESEELHKIINNKHTQPQKSEIPTPHKNTCTTENSLRWPINLEKSDFRRSVKRENQFDLTLAYDWTQISKIRNLTSSDFRSYESNRKIDTPPIFKDFIAAGFKENSEFFFQPYGGSAYEPVLLPKLPGFFRISTFFAITDKKGSKLVIHIRPKIDSDDEINPPQTPHPAYILTATNDTPYDVIGSISFTSGKILAPFLQEITERPIIETIPIPGCAIEFVDISDKKSGNSGIEYCVMLGVVIVVKNLPKLGKIGTDLEIIDPRIETNYMEYTAKAKLAIRFIKNTFHNEKSAY